VDQRQDRIRRRIRKRGRGSRVTSREDAADHAFLAPRNTRRKLAVGGKTSELGAGAGAAWRAIVRAAGAEYEVARIVARIGRRPNELDMIDLGARNTGHALATQGIPHARRERRKSTNPTRFERH